MSAVPACIGGTCVYRPYLYVTKHLFSGITDENFTKLVQHAHIGPEDRLKLLNLQYLNVPVTTSEVSFTPLNPLPILSQPPSNPLSTPSQPSPNPLPTPPNPPYPLPLLRTVSVFTCLCQSPPAPVTTYKVRSLCSTVRRPLVSVYYSINVAVSSSL